MNGLLSDLIDRQAGLAPERIAVVSGELQMGYGALAQQVRAFSGVALELGLGPGERVGVFLEIRIEAVVAMFGASAAGCVFVPINAMYRQRHVCHILRDCNVRILVTSASRLRALGAALDECPDLRAVILVDERSDDLQQEADASARPVELMGWQAALGVGADGSRSPHRRINGDMTAIFYTSGSTGMPKGVVLSHRNMTTGAESVCSYLGVSQDDRLLAAMPLSFDAGFSQLSTGFNSGAAVVLLSYLLPRDIVVAIARERITGLTGVPQMFGQMTQIPWPESTGDTLRYVASTGGRMPRATLDRMRSLLPHAQIYLMYGLTEAFRSTYLPPDQVDRRPDSIGKAIPNAEIVVVNAQGRPCGPGEEGELVHRGALVSLGYWGDPERTAERFRPAPVRQSELCVPEIAVWSGDIVRTDEEGYLYFVGRRDDMMHISGNRVSPTEVEEVVYATRLVAAATCFGVPHPDIGQGIVVVASPREGSKLDIEGILAECRQQLPKFMVPHIVLERASLPLNANGKIDRAVLRQELKDIFQGDPRT